MERFDALRAEGAYREAGAWLVRAYAAEVWRVCRGMVDDGDVAEDLTQDTFQRAMDGLPGYRGDASPRTWLLTIARNRCVDHLRATRRSPWGDDAAVDEVDAVPDLDAALPGALFDDRDALARAFAALDEGDRVLVRLRYGEGMPPRELARVFGVKPGALRMRLSRALERMRAALLEPALQDAGVGATADAEAPPPASPMPSPAATALPRGAFGAIARFLSGASGARGEGADDDRGGGDWRGGDPRGDGDSRAGDEAQDTPRSLGDAPPPARTRAPAEPADEDGSGAFDRRLRGARGHRHAPPHPLVAWLRAARDADAPADLVERLLAGRGA